MRRLSLLPLLLLAISCGETLPLRFAGKDLLDESSGLMVTGNKSEVHILVTNLKYGCAVALPYAEDWTFEPTEKKPIFGFSEALGMMVTIQTFQPGKKVDEEAFLKSDYLEPIRARNEQRGTPVIDIEIIRPDPGPSAHRILEYRHDGVKGPDGSYTQVNFWSFRQRESDNLVYEIHLSKMVRDASRLQNAREVGRIIVGKKFSIVKK